MVNPSQLARAGDAISTVAQPLGGLLQFWTFYRLITPTDSSLLSYPLLLA